MSNLIKDALKEYVAGLNRIIGDKLKYIILYGSYARGEESKNGEISDIDILIVVDEIKIKNLEKDIIDYSYEMDLKYNIILSPIVENIEEYNKKIQYMLFYKNIYKEGVILDAK